MGSVYWSFSWRGGLRWDRWMFKSECNFLGACKQTEGLWGSEKSFFKAFSFGRLPEKFKFNLKLLLFFTFAFL